MSAPVEATITVPRQALPSLFDGRFHMKMTWSWASCGALLLAACSASRDVESDVEADASELTREGVTTLSSVATQQCLTVENASTSDGARIVTAPCAPGSDGNWGDPSSQRWRTSQLLLAGAGWKLIDTHSGKCLGIEEASTSAGARAVLLSCDGRPNTLWKAEWIVNSDAYRNDDFHGGRRFRSVHSDLCLWLGEGVVEQRPCTTERNDPQVVSTVGHCFATVRHSYYTCDIPGSWTASGYGAQQTRCFYPPTRRAGPFTNLGDCQRAESMTSCTSRSCGYDVCEPAKCPAPPVVDTPPRAPPACDAECERDARCKAALNDFVGVEAAIEDTLSIPASCRVTGAPRVLAPGPNYYYVAPISCTLASPTATTPSEYAAGMASRGYHQSTLAAGTNATSILGTTTTRPCASY
jgi:hypothetical protein